MIRTIRKIIMHCSDSTYGDASVIDVWHQQRGWSGIGYHYVVTNGRRRSTSSYRLQDDGVIEPGRPLEQIGAHCKGHNRDSIGICLVSKDGNVRVPQLVKAVALVRHLVAIHPQLSNDDVRAHYEFNPGKTCPGFPIQQFRHLLSWNIPFQVSLN